VAAIRTVLHGITIYADDLTVHPHNRATLYFSSRLQDAVSESLSVQFTAIYYRLQQWMQQWHLVLLYLGQPLQQMQQQRLQHHLLVALQLSGLQQQDQDSQVDLGDRQQGRCNTQQREPMY
jgi:hypothetical protein